MVISAFVSGNILTSVFVAVYTFTVLSLFHVPGALTLASIAAICDLIPVVGFITSIACAFLMALTVSTKAAVTVALLYFAYSLVENYIIMPKVYGAKMRLSTLVVLLTIMIAGTVGGVPVILLSLPIVASFPVVERI